MAHFSTLPDFETKFPKDNSSRKSQDAQELSDNLNKRLAHLNAIRWEKKAPAMEYYDEYIKRIEALIDTFASAVPPEMHCEFSRVLHYSSRTHPPKV